MCRVDPSIISKGSPLLFFWVNLDLHWNYACANNERLAVAGELPRVDLIPHLLRYPLSLSLFPS